MKRKSLKDFEASPQRLLATGGTAVTLAALLNGISLDDITPERINGLNIDRSRLEALFREMKSLPLGERERLFGLDEGRAAVILAGALSVIRILNFFGSIELTVSMSDLLEGLLKEGMNGKNGEENG